MELVGIIISLIILAVSGQVQLNSSFLIETAGFILISLLFITTFAVFRFAVVGGDALLQYQFAYLALFLVVCCGSHS